MMINFKLTKIKRPIKESKDRSIVASKGKDVYVLAGSIKQPSFTHINNLTRINKPVGFTEVFGKYFAEVLKKRDYDSIPSSTDLKIVMMVVCSGINLKTVGLS